MSDKRFFILSIIISIVVFLVVVLLNILPPPQRVPTWIKQLPAFHATCNSIVAILLLFSLYFIKQKHINAHKILNIAAFLFSALFLISYMVYHYCAEETRFPTDNPWRPVYLFILITHIVLAALILPFILISFYYGLKMNIPKHRKIVRWSYPIWLYVAISGVIVYWFIAPYYEK